MTPAPLRTWTVDALEVRVFATQSEMAAAAATDAHQHLTATLARQERARVIFACANSQLEFLAALTGFPNLDWSRIVALHMDEYLGLPADHPASFRRFLREKVVAPAHLARVHYLEGDAEQPLDECDRYDGLVREQPIDLCCLGIGENGHIAFNDPPVANFQDPRTVKLVKLDQQCREQQVGEGHYPNLDAVPRYAFTLTIPALCAARRMICVVPERRKAQAVHDALLGPITTACPASWLRRQKHAVLYLDADSAGLLPPR